MGIELKSLVKVMLLRNEPREPHAFRNVVESQEDGTTERHNEDSRKESREEALD